MHAQLAFSSFFLIALAAAPAQQDLGKQVDRLAAPLIEAGVAIGFVIGVVDGDEVFTRGYGRVSRDGDAVPDARTLYEIGSVSKVFTSLLLADAAQRDLLKIEDAVQRHLPDGVTLRPRAGKDVLLWHLATHTSGLPRMPRDEAPDPLNPYAHYDAATFEAAIDDARARRDPGTLYEYSNLAVAILGYSMMHVNGASTFDEVLRERITGPLQMLDTAVVLSDELRGRLAPPHDGDGMPAHVWDLSMMAGAGGIRSSIDDMLKFAQLQLAPGDSPLAAAVALQQRVHYRQDAGLVLGLGWHFARDGVSCWHNGQTGGYHAYLGVVPSTGHAVCILTNTSAGHIDILGERILQSLAGMEVEPPEIEAAVAVAPAKLRPLVGKYRLMPGMEMVVTQSEHGLFAQLTGQGAFRLHARSPTEFFYRVVEASVTFEVKGDAVQRLVLHQNGRDMPFKRIADEIKK